MHRQVGYTFLNNDCLPEASQPLKHYFSLRSVISAILNFMSNSGSFFIYNFTLSECAPKQDTFELDNDRNMPDVIFYDKHISLVFLRYSYVDKYAYISLIL